MPTLGGGDGSCAGHLDPTGPQGLGRRDQRAARRHEVVHDHPEHRVTGPEVRAQRAGPEFAAGQPAPVGRRQPGGVRTSGAESEDGGELRNHTPAPEGPDRHDGEPVDVLAAPTAGQRRGRGHRHQPEHGTGRAVPDHLLHRRSQRDPEDAGEVPPGPLLVGEQGIPDRAGVVGRHRQRRQAGRLRVGPVAAGPAQGTEAPGAERAARPGTAGAPARQQQVGQDIEHAATVPRRVKGRKAAS